MVQTRRSSFAVPSLPKTSSFTNRNNELRRSRRLKQRPKPAKDPPEKAPQSFHHNNVPPQQDQKSNQHDDRPPLLSTRSSSSDDNSSLHSDRYYIPEAGNEAADVVDYGSKGSDTCKTAKTTHREHGVSKRSKSVPRDHFLRGVNLDHCSNLLTIPDPPTPQPRRRNRRRQSSSPIVRQLVSILTPPENEAGRSIVAARKPSRKSLCHVPSPALMLEDPKNDQSTDQREANSNDGDGRNICLDDDYDNDKVDTKARKRRTSMYFVKEFEKSSGAVATKQSSTVLSPRDLKTAENVDNSNILEEERNAKGTVAPRKENGSEQDNDPAMHRKSRKKRQSLVLPNDRDFPPLDLDLASPKKKQKVRRKRSSVMIPTPEKENEDEESVPQARNKRKSIVIPDSYSFENAEVLMELLSDDEDRGQTTDQQSGIGVDSDDDWAAPKTKNKRKSTALPGGPTRSAGDAKQVFMDLTIPLPEKKNESQSPVPDSYGYVDSGRDTDSDESVPQTRKKRKSIVVPGASIRTAAEAKKVFMNFAKIPNHDEENDFRSPFQHCGIGVDSDDEEFVPKTRNKRKSIVLPGSSFMRAHESKTQRKKRLSIVLPGTECFVGNEETDERVESFFQNLNCYQPIPTSTSFDSIAESDKPLLLAASPASETNRDGCDRQNLRNIIRSYCSLPEAERPNSTQAQEIQRLTGYPIPKSRETGPSARNPPPENRISKPWLEAANQRHDLLQSLAPTIQLIEENKERDLSKMADLTGCRVEKAKSGKPRYFSTTTEIRVKASVYKGLYLSALQKIEKEQQGDRRIWLENIRLPETGEAIAPAAIAKQLTTSGPKLLSTNGEKAEKKKTAKMSHSVATKSSTASSPTNCEEERADSMDQWDPNDPSSNGVGPVKSNLTGRNTQEDETERAEKDSSSREDTAKFSNVSGLESSKQQADESMEICDPDESMLDIEKSPLSVMDTTENKPKQTRRFSASCGFELSIAMDRSPELPGCDQGELLPLPSRDEESDDPEIAAAEQRLWSSIDIALETYSREVLAIQAARQSRKQLTQAGETGENTERSLFQC